MCHNLGTDTLGEDAEVQKVNRFSPLEVKLSRVV